MNDPRPPARLTSRVLTLGSITAAAILGLGLVLGFAGSSELGSLVGNVGVAVLLVTPAAGLVATWFELKSLRPTHAWLAVAVLFVLILATIVSVAARV
jgi:uncharacterized membrane protein